MTKSNQTISSEFKWDSEKLLNKIIEDWTPSFNARKEFKESNARQNFTKKLEKNIILIRI